MANYFWVGGSGTWDNSATTHWATTTGGTGGAGVPGSTDTVTLDANSGSATVTLGANVSIGQFTSSSALNTLTMSTFQITLNTASVNVWNWTGGTLNCGTSTILCQTGANQVFIGGGKTYYNLTMNGSVQPQITGVNTFNNLTRSPSGSTGDQFKMSNNQTVNGILSVSGTNNSANRMDMVTNLPAQQITITVNGSFSFSNVSFNGIVAAGTAGTWTGTSMGDAGFNSNITFDSPRTLYYVNNAVTAVTSTSTWSLSSGGTSGQNPPLPQDTVIFDANSITSAGKTITIPSIQRWPSLDFSNLLNSPTISFNVTFYIIGSLKITSAVTLSGSGAVNFMGKANSTIQSNQTIAGNIALTGPGITYKLNSSITCSGSFTLNGGTFDYNGFNLTSVSYVGQNAVRTMINSSATPATYTLTGTGTIWNSNNANLTTYGTNFTITPNNTSASTKTFSLVAAEVLPAITVPAASSGAYIFLTGGTVTFGGQFTGGPGTTHTFQNGRTYNFSVAPVLVGSSGNLVTINSNSSGIAAVFSFTGGYVGANWLSIQDNTPTQSGVWFAGHNSTLVSNTGNWILGTFTNVALNASLGLTGSIQKQGNKLLTAGITLGGSIFKKCLHTMNASLSFAGSNKDPQGQKVFGASLGLVGSQSKQLNHPMNASLALSGAMQKQGNKNLAGSVGFVGAQALQRTRYISLNGTLGLAGSMSKTGMKTLTGALGLTGGLIKTGFKYFTGNLIFSSPGTYTPAGFGEVGFGGSSFAQAQNTPLSIASLTVTYIKSKGLQFTGALLVRLVPHRNTPIYLDSQPQDQSYLNNNNDDVYL